MPQKVFSDPYDLISPDGRITEIQRINDNEIDATLFFEKICSSFKGFSIDRALVQFNIKSTFAQLGVDGIGVEYELSPKFGRAEVKVRFKAFNPIGQTLLKHIKTGAFAGKLFAADDRRLVRSPEYLTRLLGKTDTEGNPLLLLAEHYKSEEIIEQKEKNRTIVKVPLLSGHWVYDPAVIGFIETIAKGLQCPSTSFRKFLFLHQIHKDEPRIIPPNGLLLVKTMNMSMQTLFARVVHEELPKGYKHASANIIEPQKITGDIFEFHGNSTEEITHVPLEFYTLEPHREHFFFADRGRLKESIDDPKILFKAFDTAPEGKAATFIVKSTQLEELETSNWIPSDPFIDEYLYIPPRDAKEKAMVQNYIESDANYTIVKAMQEGDITSQGIILSTFFPPPLLKSFFLNERVTRSLRGIYFKTPSLTHGDYFSHEDRILMQDLAKASVDIFWVDEHSNLLLKYILRQDKDWGMFVPLNRAEDFKKATFFGIYGSSLLASEYHKELLLLFQGLLQMQQEVDAPNFNKNTPIAISTGGGPGVMAMGNQIASDLGLLSCGHAVDFTKPHERGEKLEDMNPFVQAKMTYHLEQLITRQAEFNLDFPIFCHGGVGTDFELALELLNTQVGNKPPAPILLFGEPSYWQQKISSTYNCNRKTGTIQGSEWTSNTLFCVQNHSQALTVYYKYFTRRLPIGKNHPPAELGFVVVGND